MKHYTLENKPNFKYGELVKIDTVCFGGSLHEIWEGEIIGKVSDNIIDYWIVDFKKMLNNDEFLDKNEKFKNYPYKAMSIPHTFIIDEN
jgi:hypothetical protein